jgi:hypothetical protein
MLAPPHVDGLIADLQISGDLGDRTAGGDQIEDLAAEYRG